MKTAAMVLYVLQSGGVGTGLHALVAQEVQVSLARRVVRAIGVEDTPPSQVFGAITTVRTLSHDRLLVLDAKLGKLSMFSDRGALLAAVGRLGKGPGEFINPRIVGGVEDSVFILDLTLLRMSVFAVTPGTITFERSFNVIGFPADGCIVGSQIFVLSYDKEGILHEYTMEGTRRRSFGEPLGPDAPILRGGTIGSSLVCSEDARMVVVLGRQLGVVQAYSADRAKSLWKTIPREFSPAEMTPYDGGEGMRFGVPKSGVIDRLQSGVLLAPDVLAAQAVRQGYIKRSDPKAGVFNKTITFLIQLQTGMNLGAVREDLPLIAEATNGHVWTVEDEDFPRMSYRTFHLSRQE